MLCDKEVRKQNLMDAVLENILETRIHIDKKGEY